jgi:hypothetical protein
VHYAVNDAIDLAFVLASDGRVRLVDPTRVNVALSPIRQGLGEQVAGSSPVALGGQGAGVTAAFAVSPAHCLLTAPYNVRGVNPLE